MMLPFSVIYSQTEQDYFEKLRLERKDKKIKEIVILDERTLETQSKEYYDENGLLSKKENYYSNPPENITYIYQEVIINSYKHDNKIEGLIIYYELGKKAYENPFNNESFTYFLEIGFTETLTEEARYFFDERGVLVEKRFYWEDLGGYVYDKELLYYDSKGQLYESRNYSHGSSLFGTTKYYYNSDGLLEKEVNDKSGEDTNVSKFEYKFY